MLIKEFPKLFGITSTGKVKEWKIMAIDNLNDGTATIRVYHGQLNGKIQINDKIIREGKNIGKINQTNPFEQAISEAQSAWTAKKDDKYEEQIPTQTSSNIVLPMLAQSFTKRKHNIIYPAFAQPKLNGCRCLAKKISNTEIEYTTRGGKRFTTLEHLTPQLFSILKIGETVDGEIYNHGWTFQEIIRNVKKLRETSKQLEYWIFDKMDLTLPFISRYDWLSKSIPKNCNLIYVPTINIKDEASVYSLHNEFVSDGFEGAIIRNYHGLYTPDYRSKDLQKYKEFEDKEFTIIGGEEGTGLDEGCIIFHCLNEDGKEFKVRPKGSVEQRRNWFKQLSLILHKQLTVRFQGRSEDNIPIFPVGIIIRDYE